MYELFTTRLEYEMDLAEFRFYQYYTNFDRSSLNMKDKNRFYQRVNNLSDYTTLISVPFER